MSVLTHLLDIAGSDERIAFVGPVPRVGDWYNADCSDFALLVVRVEWSTEGADMCAVVFVRDEFDQGETS